MSILISSLSRSRLAFIFFRISFNSSISSNVAQWFFSKNQIPPLSETEDHDPFWIGKRPHCALMPMSKLQVEPRDSNGLDASMTPSITCSEEQWYIKRERRLRGRKKKIQDRRKRGFTYRSLVKLNDNNGKIQSINVYIPVAIVSPLHGLGLCWALVGQGNAPAGLHSYKWGFYFLVPDR